MSQPRKAKFQFLEHLLVLQVHKSTLSNNIGELLWGQINTIVEGANSAAHDSVSGPPSARTGGTIMQNDFHYRAAARVGEWKVKQALINGDLVGYVIHHADEDATEMLKECAKVGMSNAQTHDNKNIVYVNRYDWGHHHGGEDAVETALKKVSAKKKKKGSDDEDEDDEASDLLGSRFMMLDAANVDNFLKLVSNKKPLEGNLYFKLKDNVFGVHVQNDDTEYELGWMVYSGKKHATFTDDDELIGFVYDGTYCALEPFDGKEATYSAE